MPQKTKSKTKKDMKKSIDSLWKSLQKEKGRHVAATKHVSYLTQALHSQNDIVETLDRTNDNLGDSLIEKEDKERHTVEFVADLIARLARR